MAQTDTRASFRLPWNGDRNDSDETVSDDADTNTSVDEVTQAQEPATTGEIDQISPPAARRATKLMAEFSRAMQVAAGASRDETMARFTSDAKAVIEEIHNAATIEIAALRHRADDDVAAVRDWSKAEIARVREETEARITLRKTALEGEVEAHAATIDARVERVGATVDAYETEMAEFFERLLAEEDPTRIATMAETMPEPPDLVGIATSAGDPDRTFVPFPTAALTRPMPGRDDGSQDQPPDGRDAPVSDETSDMATVVEVAIDAAEEAPDVPIAVVEPDFAAAEAEAAAIAGELDPDDDIATALAAADEGVPARVAPDSATHHDQDTTRVTVVGLVSVASIASFKRSLNRATGVLSIAVASGPEGEFIFTVNHAPGLALGDVITALAGFQARITAQ